MPDPKDFGLDDSIKHYGSPNVQRVFEIHTGWRSFRLDSVISTTPITPFV